MGSGCNTLLASAVILIIPAMKISIITFLEVTSRATNKIL
jgi:hypothetical protein